MNKALYFDFSPQNMMLERLNNTIKYRYTTLLPFLFFGTASSFIEISFSEIEAKQEAIVFLFSCSEVNSTWIITSRLANQCGPKASYSLVLYILIIIICVSICVYLPVCVCLYVCMYVFIHIYVCYYVGMYVKLCIIVNLFFQLICFVSN